MALDWGRAAAVTGAVIDLQGKAGLVFMVNTGVIAGSGDFGVTVQESDTTTSGDFADAAAGVIDADAPATLAASSAYRLPAASILDRNERPAPRPAIVLGKTQIVDEGTSLKRRHHRIFHDVHVWVTEPSTERAKAITSASRD